MVSQLHFIQTKKKSNKFQQYRGQFWHWYCYLYIALSVCALLFVPWLTNFQVLLNLASQFPLLQQKQLVKYRLKRQYRHSKI